MAKGTPGIGQAKCGYSLLANHHGFSSARERAVLVYARMARIKDGNRGSCPRVGTYEGTFKIRQKGGDYHG